MVSTFPLPMWNLVPPFHVSVHQGSGVCRSTTASYPTLCCHLLILLLLRFLCLPFSLFAPFPYLPQRIPPSLELPVCRPPCTIFRILFVLPFVCASLGPGIPAMYSTGRHENDMCCVRVIFHRSRVGFFVFFLVLDTQFLLFGFSALQFLNNAS